MLENLKERLLAAMGGREAFAASFDHRTMRDTGRRVDMELGGAEAMARAGFAAIDKAAAELGRPDLAGALQAEFLGRLVSRWTAYQHAGARTANWMVTGPARFPVARNRKRMETEDRRRAELLELEGAGAWAAKRIRRAIAAELGPIGMAGRDLEAARAKLAQRRRRQDMMKAANAALRRHKRLDPEPRADAVAADMLAAGFPEISAAVALQLLRPPFPGAGIGFGDYQLKNNGAEIRRLEGRVAELEARQAAMIAAADSPDEPERVAPDEGDGPRIVEDVADNRVRIYFPDRPPAELRARLKGRGFRWSPTAGAWQRQLTPNAIDAARAIVGQ